jgi:hypothetical protein
MYHSPSWDVNAMWQRPSLPLIQYLLVGAMIISGEVQAQQSLKTHTSVNQVGGMRFGRYIVNYSYFGLKH